jgi:hypothetical protein
MSVPIKLSWNRQRKAAYAAKADRSSRNENTIVVKEAPVASASAVIAAPTGRERGGWSMRGKRRRQEGAWTRCRFAVEGHAMAGKNCKSCGCPASAADAK